MKTIKLLLTLLLSYLTVQLSAQSINYNIRFNQLGFLPNARKIAAVINPEADSFKVVTEDFSTTVYQGVCLPAQFYAASNEYVCIADFSQYTTPGTYALYVKGLGYSAPFKIEHTAFASLSKASVRYFYYNRASMKLEPEYAGIYSREAGHPDTEVLVHPSAASPERPAGTKLSTPKGWYDAGDYNKYIVNSGISTFTLLSAYESYPEYYDTLSLNIPESNNSIPDILDEALWNIAWMMTMQDSNDGGVYNKTTTANFSGFVMPSAAASTRYVAAKGTAATLDFAAIMAMTARIYRPYDTVLANKALKQAKYAWEWAKANPEVEFSNPSASHGYPSIVTGGYGDSYFGDEFSWCASELYITTKDDSYFSRIGINNSYALPGWGDVKTLGLLSLVTHKGSLSTVADTSQIKSLLIDLVNSRQTSLATSPYRIPGDFYNWGGNSAYANWGMLFMQAFKLSHKTSYFNGALSSLDFLLGRNATTYSFVTGFGSKSPMDPHHRISGADGISAPVPGMLAGGANPGNLADDCGTSSYPSTLPARAYVDKECSYSTNEVTINWNAPLVFLSGALQYEYIKHYLDNMPLLFSISTAALTLPSKSGTIAELTIESNTDWSLTSPEDWINLSVTSGSGSGVIEIVSNTDNTNENTIEGKIYVYNNEILMDSVLVKQTGATKSFKIESENFSGMLGLQTETTTDVGGGKNIGYVDEGDWATYSVDIAYSGEYDVEFRHAGNAGDIDVYIDGVFAKNIRLNATSDWQDWVSYTTKLELKEGLHTLKLAFYSAGINLNWMAFTWANEISFYNEISKNIRVYPIPAPRQLTVDLNDVKELKEVQLISLNGKIVYRREINESRDQLIIEYSAQGCYMLKLRTNNAVITKKVVFK